MWMGRLAALASSTTAALLCMQGPKRRKIRTPAYLKEDFVTVGGTVEQLGSPDTPIE